MIRPTTFACGCEISDFGTTACSEEHETLMAKCMDASKRSTEEAFKKRLEKHETDLQHGTSLDKAMDILGLTNEKVGHISFSELYEAMGDIEKEMFRKRYELDFIISVIVGFAMLKEKIEEDYHDKQ